jgi:hypothetical protein
MTPTADRWLDDLVDEGVVAAPGSPNIRARDALMAAARTSLDDATRDPQRSAGGIIRDTENAVRQAITALAAHHGTRIIGPNKHAAIVRFAEAHPGFDDASADRIDQIRVARNAGMYGDRHEDTPIEYTAADAEHLVRAGSSVVNRVTTLLNVGRPIPPPPSRE